MGFSDRRLAELNLKSANVAGERGQDPGALARPDPRRGQGDDRRDHRGRGARAAPQARRPARCSSGSTPAPPSSRRRRPICTRPTRRRASASPRTRASRPTASKVVILGGGPNRIGQGIEFDYCCVHAAYALKEAGLRDDHDQLQSGDGVDRLRHLRPALFRAADRRGRARDPPCRGARAATLHGVIVQFGGQTPLKLAAALEKEGIPILGTSPDAIDLAEDRERFAGWSTSSASGSRRTASRAAATRRSRSPSGSAIRC